MKKILIGLAGCVLAASIFAAPQDDNAAAQQTQIAAADQVNTADTSTTTTTTSQTPVDQSAPTAVDQTTTTTNGKTVTKKQKCRMVRKCNDEGKQCKRARVCVKVVKTSAKDKEAPNA